MEEYVSKRIKSIRFGLFSPSLIKKVATAKIVTPELYDKDGYPVDGGLMDVRLGVIDPGLRCKTCGGKLKECIGHFGYIDLARPVIHIEFARKIHDLLKATCRECGKLLANDEKIEKIIKGGKITSAKSKALKTASQNVSKCPHCSAKQISVKLERPTTYFEENKRLSPIEVRSRLEKLDNDVISMLGLNPEVARPEWTILTLLPIPPVTTRPSITLESGERSEDDLTHKLSDVVRINQRLFENINAGAPEIIIEDLWDLLQYHITTYFANDISQVPPARHRSGQPLKTLSERIKSKQGRFRNNLTGKRVNYSARTFITPDPKIEFNEVGVPLIIAKNLTVAVRVTDWNMEYLKDFVIKGPNVYPGANYVVRPDGRKKRITEETKEQLLEELQVGYIVERHLMNGDISIFNRQPSLHRMSIMCHKVKILPGRSFRLNPAVCNPYNADFDGDEMNLHVPQTEEARAEAELLMDVKNHIITPKNGVNVVGCVEDSVAGNYLLTKQCEFSKEEAIGLLLSIGVDNPDSFRKFGSRVSGREIFSSLLPNDFDFIGYSRSYKEGTEEGVVKIKGGQLISGVIDKNAIGEDNGSLIRSLYAVYGEDITIKLLSKIFKLGNEVLLRTGFTTGISDSDLPEANVKKANNSLDDAYVQVSHWIKKYENGSLKAIPGYTIEETLEFNVLKILNNVRNEIGKQISSIVDESNPSIVMFNSGSKGNILNLVMMATTIGQQVLRAKRISFGYKGRTLSLFKSGDLGPNAHGFIKNSYKIGMNPFEYFYGAITGRDGLMDTALRTPKSGYLYRRLANALQDLRVEYDNTVRDANGNLIQFNYGEDGLDVSRTEGGTINVKKIVDHVTKL